MPSEREDSNNIPPPIRLHSGPALADTLTDITEQTPPPPPTTITIPKRGEGDRTTNPPASKPAPGATRSAKPSR